MLSWFSCAGFVRALAAKISIVNRAAVHFLHAVSGCRIFGACEGVEIKSKTKIVAGYLLLIIIRIPRWATSSRVAVRFSAPDRSYALLYTKRSAVNSTLYHLYQPPGS